MKYWLLWVLLFGLLPVSAQQPLYDLPNPATTPVMTSSLLASTRGGRIFVADSFAGQVTIFTAQGIEETVLDVGARPSGVAILPDNLRAIAISADTGYLSVIDLETNTIIRQYFVGDNPSAVVATATTAYVSLPESAQVVVLNLANGRILDRIVTPPDPMGLALWGDFLYVTHFWTGEFSLIYLPSGEVVRTVRPHPQASLSPSIEIDPVAGLAYLPQTIATDNPVVDARFIPVVQVIDLNTMRVARTVNLVVADRPVSFPYAVKLPANRARLYIAHAGSNDVTVLNLSTDTADSHFETGANPRAIAFNGDSTLIYTFDAIDNTLSTRDTRFFGLVDQIPTGLSTLSAQAQIGFRLFSSSTDGRLSGARTIACATCHYQIGRTEGLIAGRDSDAVASFLVEHIEAIQGGSGLEMDSFELSALVAFLQNSVP